MKLLPVITCLLLLSVGRIYTSSEGVFAGAAGGINPDVPHVDWNVCTLGPTLVVDNGGMDIGWFDVGYNPPVNQQIDNLLALANRKDLSKRVYFGFDADNRIEQIFKGRGEIVCLSCFGNTAGKNPNLGSACPDPLNTNACVQCTKEVPCNQVLSVNRCYATGGQIRAQQAGSIREKLGLAHARVTELPTGN